MKLPTRSTAEALLAEAERRNPGPWVWHSIFVARAAEAIARAHPCLEPEAAYILGVLHDLGRGEGVTDMRHVLDGYRFLLSLGYEDAARICLTHSFPIQDAHCGAGKWDVALEEFQLVQDTLAQLTYDPYDRLIQLCDSLALPTGFCLLEKRLLDVTLRHGFNEWTLRKWQSFMDIQHQFEQEIGQSIYSLLPGVIENTFGFSQPG